MFCPGCKKEFKIDGDELQELNLRNIKCPDPTCNATVSFETLEEWVKTDTKKLKRKMDVFIDEYVSQNEKYTQLLSTTDNVEIFSTFKKRWRTEIAKWLKEESVVSHVILNYLLAQKRKELEKKRESEIDNSCITCRTMFLCWRARRDFEVLETDPLFQSVSGEKIYDSISGRMVEHKRVVNGQPGIKGTFIPLMRLSNEIWIELFAVWLCFNEDMDYLMEKAESLLAADQLDSNWYREEAAWIDLYDSLVILEPQWHSDMNRWLSCYEDPFHGKEEECLEKLAQVKRRRSQEVK